MTIEKTEGFNREHYEQVKDFVLNSLKGSNYMGSRKICPVDRAIEVSRLIKDALDREDYEAAQATKDAIYQFLNELGANIDPERMINIPDNN